MPATEPTAAEIAYAAERFSDAQYKAAVASAPKDGKSVACRRCGGQGSISSERYMVCYECLGVGTTFRYRNRAARLSAELVVAAADVERLRALYRGYSLAAQVAAAAYEKTGHWSDKHTAKNLAEQAQRIVLAGKSATEKVALLKKEAS